MPLVRRVSLSILTLLATLWAGLLVFFGCSLAVRGVPGWLMTSTGLDTPTWRFLGAAIFLGGQFVFMFLVADRLFPRATRRPITWLCELGVVLAGLVALMASFFAGIVPGP
ncbi:MAG: hypothetical protein AAFY46_01335 [Planctomycetota bacterium]